MKLKQTLLMIALSCLARDIAAGTMGEPASSYRPIISFFGGVGSVNPSQKSAVFVGTDGDVFSYNTKKNDQTIGFGGVFLGIEHSVFRPNLFVDLGIEYDYFGKNSIRGTNLVGIEPITSTAYRFRYTARPQQLLGVAKFIVSTSAPLIPTHTLFPYFSVGLGAAFNHTRSFSATTQEIGSLNLTPVFDSNSQTDFSYNLGLGVDTDVTQNLRFGLGYRFSDFGKNTLSNGKIVVNQYSTPVPFSLNVAHVYANQFVVQLSYIP